MFWRPGPLNKKTDLKNCPKTALSETFVNRPPKPPPFTDRFNYVIQCSVLLLAQLALYNFF